MLGLSSSEEMYQPNFLEPIDVMASGQFNSQLTAPSPTGSRQINPQNSNNSPTSGSKIPDIILTGIIECIYVNQLLITSPTHMANPDTMLFSIFDQYLA